MHAPKLPTVPGFLCAGGGIFPVELKLLRTLLLTCHALQKSKVKAALVSRAPHTEHPKHCLLRWDRTLLSHCLTLLNDCVMTPEENLCGYP